jgi:hypothetical protein
MLRLSLRSTVSLLASLVLSTVAAPACLAWGREGHRLTALVAEDHLTPEARAQVEMLLAADSKRPETLAGVANWADEYRMEHGETAAWHYVDIPSSALTFDRMRDCPAATPPSPWRDCVTDRILYFEGRLGDTSLPLKDRAQALKFLVHLIGDVHQPFHAIGDARGGNSTHVTFLGSQTCGSSACNLHAVWDDGMIEDRGLSEQKYVALLEQDIAANHWAKLSGGSPAIWANLSHHYAVQAEVGDGAMLPREYFDEEIKVVDSQLALGGLRLAHVLNRILGDAPAADAPAAASKP